jgi:hypothetical protein
MHDCPHHGFSRSKFLAAAGAAATLSLPAARALAQAPPATHMRLIDIHHHYYPAE